MVGSIDRIRRQVCGLLRTVCNLIRKLTLYEFKLGNNSAQVAKKNFGEKDEVAIDHCKITRWFKKFRLWYENLDNQAMSLDSEIILLAIDTNQQIAVYQPSLASHYLVWVITLTTSINSLVVWVYGIHWLHLCRMVRHPPNECPTYDIKLSHDMAPVQELWGMLSIPLLSLWPGLAAPDRVRSMGPIELFDI